MKYPRGVSNYVWDYIKYSRSTPFSAETTRQVLESALCQNLYHTQSYFRPKNSHVENTQFPR